MLLGSPWHDRENPILVLWTTLTTNHPHERAAMLATNWTRQTSCQPQRVPPCWQPHTLVHLPIYPLCCLPRRDPGRLSIRGMMPCDRQHPLSLGRLQEHPLHHAPRPLRVRYMCATLLPATMTTRRECPHPPLVPRTRLRSDRTHWCPMVPPIRCRTHQRPTSRAARSVGRPRARIGRDCARGKPWLCHSQHQKKTSGRPRVQSPAQIRYAESGLMLCVYGTVVETSPWMVLVCTRANVLGCCDAQRCVCVMWFLGKCCLPMEGSLLSCGTRCLRQSHSQRVQIFPQVSPRGAAAVPGSMCTKCLATWTRQRHKHHQRRTTWHLMMVVPGRTRRQRGRRFEDAARKRYTCGMCRTRGTIRMGTQRYSRHVGWLCVCRWSWPWEVVPMASLWRLCWSLAFL